MKTLVGHPQKTLSLFSRCKRDLRQVNTIVKLSCLLIFEYGRVSSLHSLFLLYLSHDLAVSLNFCLINHGAIRSCKLRDSLREGLG